MTDEVIYHVIYFNPEDAPGRYVLRRWHQGENGTQPGDSAVFDSLEDARAALPEGVELTNFPEPDPVIVEVWW
ncbi:MAG TPA: hypothetical protein VNA20_10610 [Frankiaceae bacterium]|nr:hypothetical protein [Frankiaceae bacterium]